MIPLLDSSRRPTEFPAVTIWLVAINVVAFSLELLGGDDFMLAWSVLGGIEPFAAPIAVDSASTLPNLGASGVIAAVMGAFLVRHPHDRIKILVPIGPFLRRMSMPGAFLIGLWLLIQMLNELGSLVDTQSRGVASVAHSAGAFFSATSGGLFSRPPVLEDGGPLWKPTTRFGRHR